MLKYLSNSLNDFHFHDCLLVEARTEGDKSIWILNHVDVEKLNPLNPFVTAMETDMAIISFYDCKYRNLEIDHGNNALEHLVDITLLEANALFSYHNFSSLVLTGKYQAQVCIHYSDHLYTFDILYSRVEIEWNMFVRKSWYERDK